VASCPCSPGNRSLRAGEARAPARAPSRPSRSCRHFARRLADVFARLIAQQMSESWGAVGDREPHRRERQHCRGNGLESLPDGYTAYVCDSAIWASNPHLYAKVPTGRSRFARHQHDLHAADFLTVHPRCGRRLTPSSSLCERNPGKLRTLGGQRLDPSLTTELFKSLAGISMVHVPYGNGGRPALIAASDLNSSVVM